MTTTPYRDPAIESRLAEIERRLDETAQMLLRNTQIMRAEKLGRWAFKMVAVVVSGALLSLTGVGIYKGCQSVQKDARRRPSAEETRRTADERTCEGVGMDYLTRNDDTLLCGNGTGAILSFRREPGGVVKITRSNP